MRDQLIKRLTLLDRELLKQVWAALKGDPAQLRRFTHAKQVSMVADEIRSVSGHSLRNVFRMISGQVRPYHAILVDVADKVTPSSHKSSTYKSLRQDSTPPHRIEVHILQMLDERLKEQWRKLSTEGRDKETEKIRNEIKEALSKDDKPLGDKINEELTTQLVTQAVMGGMFLGGGLTAILSTVTVLGFSVGLSTLVSSIGATLIYYFLGTWAAAGALWTGGAATVGLATVAAPAVALIAANTIASPSYTKLIPAMLLILTSPEVTADREKYGVSP
jgi:hypothetical protein